MVSELCLLVCDSIQSKTILIFILANSEFANQPQIIPSQTNLPQTGPPLTQISFENGTTVTIPVIPGTQIDVSLQGVNTSDEDKTSEEISSEEEDSVGEELAGVTGNSETEMQNKPATSTPTFNGPYPFGNSFLPFPNFQYNGFTNGLPLNGFPNGLPPNGFPNGIPTNGFPNGIPPNGFPNGIPPNFAGAQQLQFPAQFPPQFPPQNYFGQGPFKQHNIQVEKVTSPGKIPERLPHERAPEPFKRPENEDNSSDESSEDTEIKEQPNSQSTSYPNQDSNNNRFPQNIPPQYANYFNTLNPNQYYPNNGNSFNGNNPYQQYQPQFSSNSQFNPYNFQQNTIPFTNPQFNGNVNQGFNNLNLKKQQHVKHKPYNKNRGHPGAHVEVMKHQEHGDDMMNSSDENVKDNAYETDN